MKKWLILLGIVLGLAYTPQAQETVKIATGEYAPFTGEKLHEQGFVNHVVKAAFEKKNVQVQFDYMPWKRAAKVTETGQYQASSYWTCNDERKAVFYCSGSVIVGDSVFFHLKTTKIPEWETFKDLKDFKIGATRGYTYSKEFWEAEENKVINVDLSNADLQNFKKMLKGRVDLVINDEVSGYTLLHEEFSPAIVSTITSHHKGLGKVYNTLMFPKSVADSERLLKIFNEGLQELKDNGTYDKMRDDLLTGKYSK